jgi:pyridoxine kinase
VLANPNQTREKTYLYICYMQLSEKGDMNQIGATKRVLSIQSHVVSGYVGNKCAVLPLNRLGFDVDAINSVQFSNHTGYSTVKGQKLSGDDLEDLSRGLEENGLFERYTHILTGYIGNVSMLESIAKIVKKLKREIPDVQYVCDPVCGDDGRLYCHPDMPHAFETILVPLATVVTPNQFEAELLTRVEIACMADAVRACDVLHEKGPNVVVITSLSFPENKGSIVILASIRTEAGSDGNVYTLSVPKIEGYFTGTGDLFSALLLGWIDRYPGDLQSALEHAVGGLQAVLKETVRCIPHSSDEEYTATWWKGRDLRLIESQDKLIVPNIQYFCKQIV